VTFAIEDAEQYCWRLQCGTELEDPAALRAALEYLRGFRLSHRLEASDNGAGQAFDVYQRLVGVVHRGLFALHPEIANAEFTPHLGGRANWYSGTLETGGESKFLKVTRGDRDNEARFIRALLDGSVPARGRHYEFQVPERLIDVDGEAAFLLDNLSGRGAPSFDWHKRPDDVRMLIAALAEANASMGLLTADGRDGTLSRASLDMPASFERRVDTLANGLDSSSRETFARKAQEVATGWGLILEAGASLPWALGHGDPARGNLARRDGRVILLDPGQAGLWPIGSDLYWLIYRNAENPQAAEEIIGAYHGELRSLGIDVDMEQVRLGAEIRYLLKWLTPRTTGTGSEVGHFQTCLDRAVALIDRLAAAEVPSSAWRPAPGCKSRVVRVSATRLADLKIDEACEVAVIMPSTDAIKAQETARLLAGRAGMACRILVVQDTLRQGFIKTLNAAAGRLSAKYVVYVAQDAFPGADWLKIAYERLEESGKGLLAFNDGKWHGRIAGFGMVRKSWVDGLYGGPILNPSYHGHKADNELTVIARATDQYLYEPNATLIEYDVAKALKRRDKGAIEGDKEDRAIFRKRFRKGFDGLVDADALLPLAEEYRVRPKKRADP
jgi:hypothetical protein